MQKLSSLDAAFIYLESARIPMHVGGLYVFAAPARTKPPDFAAWREHIGARLHLCRTLRQRLVRVPLALDRPYWVEDPEFDLEAHLRQAELPAPGGWQELMALAEEVFSRPLAQDRPLWEMVLVTGLKQVEGVPSKERAFAMLVKMHHAAADGVAGETMVQALLDPAPAPRSLPPSESRRPERIPGRVKLLGRACIEALGTPLTLARLAGRVGAGAVQGVRERVLRQTPLPPLPFAAPPTRFNAAVTTARRFRGLVLPLTRIKAIKNAAPGSTINDVVLAVCAGALRRYLEAKGELPDGSLVAAVPVSIRTRAQWHAMGNRVSALLVALATTEADPLKRLACIRENTANAKVYGETFRYDWTAELIPPALGTRVGQLLLWLLGGQRSRPLFNLFITNVPGPRQPLYLGGARLLYHLGTAPVLDGLGLVLVITSDQDTLCISATACRELLPDPDYFMDCLKDALEELETALAKAPQRAGRVDSAA